MAFQRTSRHDLDSEFYQPRRGHRLDYLLYTPTSDGEKRWMPWTTRVRSDMSQSRQRACECVTPEGGILRLHINDAEYVNTMEPPLPPNSTDRAQHRQAYRPLSFSTIVGPSSEQRGGVQLLSSSALHTSGSSTSSRRMGSMHQHQRWPLTLALPAWVPSPTVSDDIAEFPKYFPTGADPHVKALTENALF